MAVNIQILSLACGMALAGCAPPIAPTDTGAMLHLYSGGPFHGAVARELFRDDVLRVTVTGPFGKPAKTTTRQLRAGAFAAARDHVLNNQVPAKELATDGECMDYGVDIVSYTEPDRRVEMRSVCPNERLLKLLRETGEIIARHDAAAPQ